MFIWYARGSFNSIYLLTCISSYNRFFERRIYSEVCRNEIQRFCGLIFPVEPLLDSSTRLFLIVCLFETILIHAHRLVCSCEVMSNRFHSLTNFINERIPRVWRYARDSRIRIA